MKKYIFLLIVLLVLTTPLFQSQSETADQIQPATSSRQLNIVTSTFVVPEQELVPKVNLKPGDRHKEVKILQKFLKLTGHLPENLQLTEIFGPKTKKALIKFQISQGLPATGVFDEATRLAFEKYLSQKSMIKKRIRATGGDLKEDYSKINEFFSNLVSRLDRNVSTTCMKLAVEKRENSIISSWEAYTSKVKSAYETRKNELIAAWAIIDPSQRQIAVKNAWDKYREAVKLAQTEWFQTRKNSWLQFTQEANGCKALIFEPQEIEETEEIRQ
ncbi:MAG: peptidoglycan-binding protein [Candidatus Omnitrophica bacterium]|nr:peptidoglycan-binding protein [Candidatus Omnitrophota bacterium]